MKVTISLLDKQIRECKKCYLCKKRTLAVPGIGPKKAKIMIVGEAPGKEEDLLGLPFVGKAGQILDKMLSLQKLKREDIFITNLVKCRPFNKTPKTREIKACFPYLEKQIQLISPSYIITLGNIASKKVFKKLGLKFSRIGLMHGKIFLSSLKIKVIALYHPASALYNKKLFYKLTKFSKKFKFFKKNIFRC